MHPQETRQIPVSVLDTLLVGHAVEAAHYCCCEERFGRTYTHPGDPFGRVIGWLWQSGDMLRAARLATDFLGEMRVHNPHRHPDGERLTLDQFLDSVGFATSAVLSPSENDELVAHLREQIPHLFGASPDRLNER